MKILYVLSTGPLYGDNIALLSILPLLKDRGIKALIIVPDESDSYYEFKRLGYLCIGYKYAYSNITPSRYLIGALFFKFKSIIGDYIKKRYIEYFEILRQVKKFNPDIIHTNCSFINMGVRLAKDINIPHIMHIREYGVLDARISHFPNEWLFGMKCKRFGYNITITKDIQKYFKLKDSNTKFIYDGVFSIKSPYKLIENKEKYFLYVGRLCEQKGVLEAISTFKKFHDIQSDYKLLIAGTGPSNYTNEIIKCIENLNLVDCVELLGYRKDAKVLMQTATALLVPSYFEAFGFITAEALFNGCPVIGRLTAGTEEQYKNIRNIKSSQRMFYTYLCDDEMLQAMQDISSEKITNHTMLQYHNKVYELYSAEKSSSCVYDFYQDIINNR